MSGQLFKQYFLTDGIRETLEWRESVKHAEAFSTFTHTISTRFNNFSHFSNPNEAVTEKELICPVLEALGWTDYMPQQGSARKEDIPDHLLFADAEAKYGRYRTKDLILAYMNALAAGDTETIVAA